MIRQSEVVPLEGKESARVIARSEATWQTRISECGRPRLPRFARNDVRQEPFCLKELIDFEILSSEDKGPRQTALFPLSLYYCIGVEYIAHRILLGSLFCLLTPDF